MNADAILKVLREGDAAARRSLVETLAEPRMTDAPD
jgi:hypothetical protein